MIAGHDARGARPRVSLVLPLSGNSAAAERALGSLSVACQRNVQRDDYEIVVIEEPSPDVLGEARAKRADAAVRYFAAEAAGAGQRPVIPWPVTGLIGWLLEPTVVTPRVMEHAILAAQIAANPLIVVPSYELLPTAGTRDDAEAAELWATMNTEGMGRNGAYQLFDRAQFGAANPTGFLADIRGATLFFHEAGVAASQGDESALGSLRTAREIYADLWRRSETRLIVLGGEGCFRAASQARVVDFGSKVELEREPLLFGVLPGLSHLQFRRSIKNAGEFDSRTSNRGVISGHVAAAGPLVPSVQVADSESVPRPKVSIVVVVYDMPRQAENTIYSLSARHQANVSEEDYEVIVVENGSRSMLGSDRATGLGANIRYFARDEVGVSPAPALNFGIAQARAPAIGLMIDGARMVTPRLIEHVLAALRPFSLPLIVAPGYHLGPKPQHLSSLSGYGEDAEQELLHDIDWKASGYRLFEVGCVDGTNENGFLNPLLESTCIFFPKHCLEMIGGVDERFRLAGGGIVNLDIFDRLCRLEGTRLVVLWGEGAFHQYHGGVSSRSSEERERLLEIFRQEYERIRGRGFSTWERQPVLLGTNAPSARRLAMFSAWYGRIRYDMSVTAGTPEWPRD